MQDRGVQVVDVHSIFKLDNYPQNAEHPQGDEKDLQKAKDRYKQTEKHCNTNHNY